MRTHPSPAYRLVGHDLPNDWHVTERLELHEDFSAGQNSVGYFVNSPTRGAAFLKAFDYHAPLLNPNSADDLYELTRHYRYERDLFLLCQKAGLNKVVRLIDHNGILLDKRDPASRVQYLILERAQNDIRSFAGNRNNEISWTLNMMHQIVVATQQLHSASIAHQDIKPGNTLIFDNNIAKLGDLGRATQYDNPSPFDHHVIAGDPDYAPPELLYHKRNEPLPDWNTRRLGCDFYMLGSVIYYLCAGVSITHRLYEKLDPEFWPEWWTETYDDVLPFVQEAFVQCVDELEKTTHESVASEVANMVKQLCDPRPRQRGLPMNKGYNQYSLRRFVSKLNLLHRRNQLEDWRDEPISLQTTP